ncbi:Glucomannan 4-beta-mannosyltransferase [Seminavis robusta]|uniref:Glucomannan 4-beta-mannosyltransferase n=1 Tax=Seminavis robusta TaxID=568900 RepID=A0A9N8HN98_9STRA|nr:Glucomannan 4-beta-mannosyltransferase [Seminavis robusta]|eukprot:Sro1191_g250880.1 Glucomannan 4-beta-mannosyltransferase (509) ;mRNA; f:4618-6784
MFGRHVGESSVIEPTINAACQVDWPKDKLCIEILDDSSDKTSEIIETIGAQWREKGVNCVRLTRPNRIGYKLGSLHAHSPDVQGELVALFDADHRCEPDYLRKAIPHFFNRDGSPRTKIRLVATPWAYYNTHQNLLTEYDSLVLDYVFGVDRVGLAGAQNLFGFNGTGGVWRQAAIDVAGGWKWDTVTEDLDTSILAHMQGYEFVYLRHSPDIALNVKLGAVFHLTVSMTYPIALVSVLLKPVVASFGAFTLGLLLYVKGFNTFVFVLGILTASFGKVSRNGHYQSFWSRLARAVCMLLHYQIQRSQPLHKNETDSVVVSETNTNDKTKQDNNSKKKKKKSYENEHIKAILGLVFAVYDWIWIAINVRSRAVTEDPIAIFMGIFVPLLASIGYTYMQGLFLYELVLRYLEKRKRQSKAFQVLQPLNKGAATRQNDNIAKKTKEGHLAELFDNSSTHDDISEHTAYSLLVGVMLPPDSIQVADSTREHFRSRVLSLDTPLQPDPPAILN